MDLLGLSLISTIRIRKLPKKPTTCLSKSNEPAVLLFSLDWRSPRGPAANETFCEGKRNESKPSKQLMESPSDFQFSFSLTRVTALKLTGHFCLNLVPSPAVENPTNLKEETPQIHIGMAGWRRAVRSEKQHPGKDPERVVPEKNKKRLCKTTGQVEGSAQRDKHP